MGTLKRIVRKGSLLGEMGFIKGGGNVNWFPGHMAAATRAIRDRLKLSDFVIEVRDARIPLSSTNNELQPMLAGKRRVIALNKKDLANPNIMHKWIRYFDSCEQDSLSINAHSKSSVKKILVTLPISEASVFLPDTKIVLSCITRTHVKLLDIVEFKLKEVISREPTLLVMVVGVPNVGKSALINSIHQIASIRFPVQEKRKRATVGPLPGVTQDIAGFKIAHRPSIYVLDTPGVLVPSIPDIETGLKLAVAGSVKDSIVGEERIVQYLLALLSIRGTPLHWKNLTERETKGLNPDDKPDYDLKNLVPTRQRKPPSKSDVHYVEDIVAEVQGALCVTQMEFNGDLEDEDDLENLIELQFEALQKALKVPHKTSEARTTVSKKFLTLFRAGKLGTFTFDDVPELNEPMSS